MLTIVFCMCHLSRVTSSCPAGNVGHTWKKVEKILNATGIFQQESIDQVLVCSVCFVLSCFFFPLLVCLILCALCSLFRLSWISVQTYSAWLPRCTSTEGDVKQHFWHWNSCQLHLWACNCTIQAWCWGRWGFFPRKHNCWIMLIMPIHPVVCLQTPLYGWLNAF